MALYTARRTYILTSGSDLNQAAVEAQQNPGVGLDSGSSLNIAEAGAPWPALIDAGYPVQVSHRPNNLHDFTRVSVGANYGAITSDAGFQRRGREFPGIAGMPGPDPSSKRPTYNNLAPITWGLRVVDPRAQAQPDELINWGRIQSNNLEYTTASVASLYPNEQV